MSDLSEKEQRNVRTALRFLRYRVGAWTPVAAALKMKPDSLGKVVSGRRGVTPRLAIRVARLVETTVDELLGGRLLSSRTCPHCGRPPDDFVDEETMVENGPRVEDRGGNSRRGILKLVK